MKTFIMLGVILVSLLCLSSAMKQQEASAQPSATASAGGAQVVQSASGSAKAGTGSALDPGNAKAVAEKQPASCEQIDNLNLRTAKAGDAVVVKTTGLEKTADGVMIPKGSRLVGHVTDVQAHGSWSRGVKHERCY